MIRQASGRKAKGRRHKVKVFTLTLAGKDDKAGGNKGVKSGVNDKGMKSRVSDNKGTKSAVSDNKGNKSGVSHSKGKKSGVSDNKGMKSGASDNKGIKSRTSDNKRIKSEAVMTSPQLPENTEGRRRHECV